MSEAAVLRKWLLNGAVGLYAADIDIVLSALGQPINEPVDPLETPQDARERRSYIQLLQAQLRVVQASR
jgi:hypothetical protein